MPKFVKFLICLVLEVVCILAGMMIGGWWPVRDVPADQIWAGDGIGILMFGFIGAVAGAVVGAFVVAFFLAFVRRTSHRKSQQVAPSSEGVWPPPPSNPAA